MWLMIEPPGTKEIHPQPLTAVLTCGVSNLSLVLSLLYNMLLIILCTFYAFKTRKIPENFNEAKYIGFTMYSTCIVWLAFVAIYFGTYNDYKVRTSTKTLALTNWEQLKDYLPEDCRLFKHWAWMGSFLSFFLASLLTTSRLLFLANNVLELVLHPRRRSLEMNAPLLYCLCVCENTQLRPFFLSPLIQHRSRRPLCAFVSTSVLPSLLAASSSPRSISFSSSRTKTSERPEVG